MTPTDRPSPPVAPPRRAVLKPLSEQVVVVTGATSGIGLATARKAASRGAALVLAARNEAALQTLAQELGARGARVRGVAVDVSDEAAGGMIAEAADQAFGGFDTWVNNAGVSIYGKLEDVPVADQKRLFETNYWGTVMGTLAAVARLKARPGGGAVINVGSVLSDQAVPLQGAYCASKHALKGFTNALRMELIREGAPVSLTLIKPSAIDTPYKEHARSYVDFPVTNPPPVYDAALVADAILYAAETPVREITVGGAGRALAAFGQFLPRLAEPLYAWGAPLLMRDKPSSHPRDTDALHKPGADMRERGVYSMVRKDSLWLRAQMNPNKTMAIWAAGFAGLVLALQARDAVRLAGARREGRRRAVERLKPKADHDRRLPSFKF